MGYRKIIGFGDSSFIVSLPKGWVTKNGLKKGDVISVEEDGNQIKIIPSVLKQTSANNEIKINFDGNIKKLKSEVLYAYINNYNVINVLGDNIHKHLDSIKNITRDFMYLDIVDQTSHNKIVLNTSINLFDISIYDTLRRMDRIVLSMSEDVKEYLLGKNTKVDTLLDSKEENINKLCNLVFKTLKGGFNPNDRAILNLDINDIFYYWELALFMEKIADQLKRMPRYVKPNVPKELVDLFDKAMAQYSDAAKANFARDHKLAVSVISKKKLVYDDAEKLWTKLPANCVVVTEKIGTINNYSGNVAKALLRLKSIKTEES